MYFLLIVLLGAVGVVGDFFIKLSGAGKKYIEYRWFILGAVIYALTSVGWFIAMKHTKLSSLGVIYSLTTVLLLILLGTTYFHEKLNAYEVLGIVLAVASLILLSRFA